MDLRRLAQNVSSGDRSRQRMARTGLSPNGHPLWVPPETGSLKRNVPDYDTALVEIGRRTRSAAHSKASRMGIARPASPPWNDERDVPRLRRLYPTGTKAEILAAFPNRSWGAICAKARSRHIYRKRRFKPSGSALIDQLLARAATLNMSLVELDAAAGCGRYFSTSRYRDVRRLKPLNIARAAAAMGGTLRARFVATGP